MNLSQKMLKAKLTSLQAYTPFQSMLFRLSWKLIMLVALKDLENRFLLLVLVIVIGIWIKLGKWSLKSSIITPEEILDNLWFVKI
jgi:hypothetical protein